MDDVESIRAELRPAGNAGLSGQDTSSVLTNQRELAGSLGQQWVEAHGAEMPVCGQGVFQPHIAHDDGRRAGDEPKGVTLVFPPERLRAVKLLSCGSQRPNSLGGTQEIQSLG